MDRYLIISPDSFKGSLSAQEAATAMAAGLRRADPLVKHILLPLADGGEGSLAALAEAYPDAQWIDNRVHDAAMEPITARWIWVPSKKLAFIEMAEAAGLAQLDSAKRNPLKTSSFGVGELICAAADHGAKEFVLTLGGSATVDGGTGLARALGYQFLNKNGHALPMGGGALCDLHKIETFNVSDWLRDPEIKFSCLVDVNNPLLGEHGAATVYGPQKGASPEMVAVLEAGLKRLSNVAAKLSGIDDVHLLPGAGSAGGTSAGLKWFTGAEWKNGADAILDILDFDRLLELSDGVLTGEGKTEVQTAHGKLIWQISKRCQKAKKKVHIFSGDKGAGWEIMLTMSDSIHFLTDIAKREEAMQYAGPLLERLVAENFKRKNG